MPSRIFFTTQAGATDTFLTSANVDGTNVVSQVADTTPGSPWQETVIDAANNRYFILQHANGTDDNATLYTGQLNSSAAPTVAFTFQAEDLVRGLEIDPVNHHLFIGRLDFDATQTNINNAATGLLQIDYNPATGAVSNTNNFLVTQTTDPLPSGFILTTDIARDDGDGTLYFAQSTAGAGTNMIYRVDTSNNITTLLKQSQFPTNFTNGFIADVDVDAGRNQVYFSTFAQPFGAGPTNKLWVISDTAIGSTDATALTLSGMPGGATFIPGDFTIDQSTHQLYVESEENPGSGNSDDLIYRFQLSADGKTATFLNVIDPPLTTSDANIGGIEFVGNVVATLDLDANNSSSIGTGYQATFTEGGAAVAVADADTTIVDDGTTITSATITITNHQASDLLSVSGVLPGGIIASAYNAGTGVLTLTGSATLAQYQTALQQLRFSNSSDTPNTADRSITVTVNDGETNSNTATATIHVTATNDAPTLTGDLSAAVGEGASYVITTTDLNFSDPDDVAAGVTFTVSSQVSGTVLVNGSAATTFTGTQLAGGLVSFLHNGSEGPAASFSVSVEDGNEDVSAPVASTFNFTVNNTDDPGVAQNDAVATDEATKLSGADVFADNGSGADNDPDTALSVALVNGAAFTNGVAITLASGALLTMNADGTFDYDPNGKFEDLPGPASGANNLTATDSFTYTLAGGGTATVTVTVSGLDSDNDVLEGTAGADTFAGGIGDDTYQVDNAADTVTELSGNGTADRVLTSVSFALGAGQEIEFLETSDASATTAIDLRGNSLAQTIEGNDGNNILHDGGTGPLPGYDGDPDTLIGHDGDDVYVVYLAGATIVEVAGEGVDRLSAGGDYVLASGVSIERLNTASLFATYSINLTGNELVQLVRGNNGANTLDGGGGNDVLFGMGGADNFRFSTALGPTNVADIADFAAGTDKIHLDDAIFTALGGLGALAATAFKDTATGVKDADDRIIYNSDTGALAYDADGSGTAFANIRFATITGSPLLTAADFVVV
ncbi:beta strand repeat-containing protein [Mesorhizobium sp. IMUNJ 23232]|uniref:beta strand repeat-containing protein n=1 Tax=Mesorhizobium sp. IMUNJ 23232 TaxID=3376064 RepID=UPI00379F092B